MRQIMVGINRMICGITTEYKGWKIVKEEEKHND